MGKMAMKPSPSWLADSDLSLVPSYLPWVDMSKHEPFVFTDGSRFYTYLQRKYDSFDVMTYSCTSPSRLNVVRLIFQIPPRERISYLHKRASDVHIKLYIGRRVGTPVTAFVGSHNYVEPTNSELMVQCNSYQTSALVDYFNKVWSRL